jgi:hypothetical protein
MKDICEEPGCGRAAIVGLRGTWLCLAHFDKHLATMKAVLQKMKKAVNHATA